MGELTALQELPYIQRLIYLMGIRPYMDRATGIVGIKRRISYQSLREVLYVAPIAGVKTGSPSLQQVKRGVKSLERAGIILNQSINQQLILKCLLPDLDNFNQRKAIPKPNHEADFQYTRINTFKSESYGKNCLEGEPPKILQADIPHINNNYFIYLHSQFEKFWSLYPQKTGKQKAWEAFEQLNPSQELITEMLAALKQQIDNTQSLKANGQWTPNWKHPANWLAQQCWEDEINLPTLKGNHHEKHQRSAEKQSPFTRLWESCQNGADFDFDTEEPEQPEQDNTNPIYQS